MVGLMLKKKKNKLNNDVKIYVRIFIVMEGLLWIKIELNNDVKIFVRIFLFEILRLGGCWFEK